MKPPELIVVKDQDGGFILAELEVIEGVPEYLASLDSGKVVYFYKYKEYYHSIISLLPELES